MGIDFGKGELLGVEQQTSTHVEQAETSVTRSVRRVNKPIRYHLVTVPQSSQEKREEVVRTGQITEMRPGKHM